MTQINAGRVRFVSRGEYNNSTQYYLFDLVNYNGNSYYAKENTLGNLPTDASKWQLIAEKGSTGSTGPTGATGNGIASITKISSVDTTDTYRITFTDGTTYDYEITNGEVSQAQLDEVQEQVDRYKMLENALPHITGTGTELTLNNTANAGMTIDLEPNTSQETTTGKNKFNNGATPGVLGNATVTKIDTGVKLTTTSVNDSYIYVIYNIGTTTDLLNKTLRFKATINTTAPSPIYRFGYCDSNLGNRTNETSKHSGETMSMTVTDTTKTNVYLALFLNNSSTVQAQGTTADFINTILTIDNEDLDYEPYTGSIPAPNSDYPQDIHVVSGDNSVKVENKNLIDINNSEEGGIDSSGVEVSGSSNWRSNVFIKVTPNTQYTFSLANSMLFRLYEYDENKNFISPRYEQTTTSKTITTTANTKYLKWTIYKANGITFNDIKALNVMLEQNSTATSYEPHEEQIVQLNLGDLEYVEIPNSDYKDKFVIPENNMFNVTEFESQLVTGKILNDNGEETSDASSEYSKYKMYVKANEIYHIKGYFQRIYLFNMSNSLITRGVVTPSYNLVDISYTPTIDGYFEFQIHKSTWNTNKGQEMINVGSTALPYEPYGNGKWYLKKNIGKVVFTGASSENWSKYLLSFNGNFPQASSSSLCSHFVDAGTNWTSSDETYRGKYSIKNSLGQFKCMPLEDMTLEEFKTWLSTHNTIVYYVLATPTYTPLNDILQNALNTLKDKLLAYKDQTNISQVNDDLPFEIVASALKDISNL